MSKKQKQKKRLRLQQKRMKFLATVTAAGAIGLSMSAVHADEVNVAVPSEEAVPAVVTEETATTTPEKASLDLTQLERTYYTLSTLVSQSPNLDSDVRQEAEAALSRAQAVLQSQHAESQEAVQTMVEELVLVTSQVSQALTPSVATEAPASETTTADLNADTAETTDAPVAERTVEIPYVVTYTDKADGTQVYREDKSISVRTSAETARTSVTENGAALTNAVALSNYYLPADQSSLKTVEVTEGLENQINYVVEKFQETAVETSAPSRRRRDTSSSPTSSTTATSTPTSTPATTATLPRIETDLQPLLDKNNVEKIGRAHV